MEKKLLSKFNRTIFFTYIIMIIIVVGVFYKEILNSNRIYLDNFHDHMRMQELWLINHQSTKRLDDIEGPDIAYSYLVDSKGNIKHQWDPEFKVDPKIISATKIGLNPELDTDFDFDDILPDFSGEDNIDNDKKPGDKNNEGLIEDDISDESESLDMDDDKGEDLDVDDDKDDSTNSSEDVGDLEGDLDIDLSLNEIDEAIRFGESELGLGDKKLVLKEDGVDALKGQDDFDFDFGDNENSDDSSNLDDKESKSDDDLGIDFGDDLDDKEKNSNDSDDIEFDGDSDNGNENQDDEVKDDKSANDVNNVTSLNDDNNSAEDKSEKENIEKENSKTLSDNEFLKQLIKEKKSGKVKTGLIRMNDRWVYVSSDIALSGQKYTLVGILKNKDLLKRSALESLDTLLLAFGLLSLLILIVFRSIKNNIVIPANALLNHIKTRGRGTYANAHIDDGWRIWFDSLSEVFAKNDELVAKLQDTIDNLDDLVQQRSQGLIEKNRELQMVIKELQNAQEKIILQEKMSSLGTITAGIAHELKNPLNFVINFSKVSKELIDDISKEIDASKAKKIGSKTKEEVINLLKDITQNMDYIKEHGERADAIIKNMLLQARSNNKQEMEETDLAKLISENVDLAIAGTRGANEDFNPSVEIEIDNSLGQVKLIPSQISRAILNLVGNSCQAMLEKSKKRKNYSPSINVTLRKLEDKAEIRIWDNGMGMTKETLEKIFDPFFTTKNENDGTGLGMAMVYDIIVNNHGGTITANSKRGEFTEFVITLPINK